jgi:hypothetical protein
MSKGKEEFNEPDLLEGLISAADLDEMVFDPLVEHVPNLITEGYGILAGSPKIGKSWFATGIALAVAQGGTALGCVNVQKRRVMLLALEDGQRRMQSRLRYLNKDQPLPPYLSIKFNVHKALVVPTIAEWLDLHGADENPPMVVLDTLGKAKPQRRSGDDPYTFDYDFGTRIKDTIDAVPGASLLAVHHMRKAAAEDWVEAVGGTQGVTGAADFVLGLTRKRKSDEGLLAVTGRDIRENEYAVITDNGRWRLDGSDYGVAAERAEVRQEQDQLGDRALQVLAFVNGRTETQAKDVVDHLGVEQGQARVYLSRLAESGRIRKVKRGFYAPVTNITSVTNDDNVTVVTPMFPDNDGNQ